MRSTAQATAEGLRIFVAGIPWKVDEALLRRDFEECGAIEDLFLMRDADGNSRGRAMITFQEASSVQAALKYDNTDYGGRKIFVKVAEEKVQKEKKPQQEKDVKEEKQAKAEQPKEKPDGCVSLCLKNIGTASEADIKKFLAGCAIQAVRIVVDRQTGEARGIAFVDFPQTEEVDKAVEHAGKKLKGQVVEMHYEAPRVRPRPEGCLAVAIKKLPAEATEVDVRKLFKGLSSISEVRVIFDKWTKSCTGLAFVEFTEAADVEAAVKRDGMSVKGQTVFICYETKQKKERPKPAEAKSQAKSSAKSKKAKSEAPKEADAPDEADEDDVEPASDAQKEAKKARKDEARRLRRKRKQEPNKTDGQDEQEEEAGELPHEAATTEDAGETEPTRTKAPRKKKTRKALRAEVANV